MSDRLENIDLRQFMKTNFKNIAAVSAAAGVRKTNAWKWIEHNRFPMKDIENSADLVVVQNLAPHISNYTALELAMINRPALTKLVNDHVRELERRRKLERLREAKEGKGQGERARPGDTWSE